MWNSLSWSRGLGEKAGVMYSFAEENGTLRGVLVRYRLMLIAKSLLNKLLGVMSR